MCKRHGCFFARHRRDSCQGRSRCERSVGWVDGHRREALVGGPHQARFISWWGSLHSTHPTNATNLTHQQENLARSRSGCYICGDIASCASAIPRRMNMPSQCSGFHRVPLLRGNRVRRAVGALLAMLLFSAAPLAAADPCGQVWLLSTREAPVCGDLEAGRALIQYWRLGADAAWQAADAAAFHQGDSAALPTTIFLHGNRIDPDAAVEEGLVPVPAHARAGRRPAVPPADLVVAQRAHGAGHPRRRAGEGRFQRRAELLSGPLSRRTSGPTCRSA